MNEIKKYKHYLIVLTAVLFALYVTEPLWLMLNKQKETLLLSDVRIAKAQRLMRNKEQLDAQLQQLIQDAEKVPSLVFVDASEGEYKLSVQTKIEAILQSAGCKLNILNWDESAQILNNLEAKSVKVDFSGSPLCLAKTFRAVENSQPVLRIVKYAYGARGWYGKINENLEAEITIKSWRKVAAQ
ncbi:hypothetical protein PCIT_a1684 [Pseudoalteromonas citrea]|uniref:Uncharacterized protein n=2 Tax=Pseudoalteromonas citrea TaxID=43655 RepID=A0AAD4FTY4_9GAMM|nr:hypothetical protein [Pseudoalteromonas citrea]KAF7775482.1 hypothetical protein PCIT_a1684 [Pseudoalteromonas citrea]